VAADLRDRVALVTGASSGIGLETARGLARLGARVVLACRDPDRGETARRAIVASTGARDLEVLVVDVARPASVADLARAFRERHDRLDILVNNAGLWSRTRRETAEGVELTWATNVLGYARVAGALLEPLRRAGRARIVVVASQLAHSLDLTDPEFRKRPYRGVAAYAQSKQANRLWAWALARRFEGSGVTVNAMHPGGVATGIFRKGGGWLGPLIGLVAGLFSRPAAEGADTLVWLAGSPEVEGLSGRFFIDRQERRCRFRDPEAEDRLAALLSSYAT
jgi:NAD(P)-dependent dehydrogenase (short-subunit alcohol dehydrogenase family)